MDMYFENNRELWDGWARLHAKSDFYDVKGFKAGKTSLQPIELEELGDVEGKSLLHLQCHFGLDTLSWARRGAKVTGVDFSGEAISLARGLSEKLGIETEFMCSNIFDLPDVLDRQFGIVFTSYGVLCWLSDINRWAAIARRYLKPGGIFYMVEFHPFAPILDDGGDYGENPYFHSEKPIKYETKGSYAAPETDFSHTGYEWMHGLGDIVTALISAGLTIEFLHEFTFSPYDAWGICEEIGPGKYVLKGCSKKVPLLFSIRATC